MKNDQVKKIVETSILVAVAVVLDVLFKLIPICNMPNGGHISLAMLPVLVIGFRNGWKYGIAGSFVYAVINFFIDGIILHIGSIFFDYIFAFTVLGLSGFIKEKGKSIVTFNITILVLCFIRYLFHGFSGVIFFKEYAYIPDNLNWDLSGTALYYVYSFIIYNLPYMGLSTILCMIVGSILHRRGIIYKDLEV